MLDESPILNKKSALRKFSAPARVVIDSPPTLSTRVATRRMVCNWEPSPNDNMANMEVSLGSSRTRRSLNDKVERLLEAGIISKDVENEELQEVAEAEHEKMTEVEFEEVAEVELEELEIMAETNENISISPAIRQQMRQALRKSDRLQKTSEAIQNEFQEASQDRNANEINALKKTRGKTTLANLIKRNNDSMKINWNEKGQLVGTNSVKFSSFVGALVREIVPYTISDWRKISPIMRDVLWASIQAKYDLHEYWQNKMCFEMKANLWRSAKSRLVKDIIDAKTENERLVLKPDCIKSDVEWREQKASKEHMTKQTLGGKVTRIDDFRRAHTKKNGEPINQTTSEVFEELDEIIRKDPKFGTTNNTDEDALTKLFGNPKFGHLIRQGRGVTGSKLTVVNMCKNKMTLLEEEQLNMKSQIAEMLNLLKGHLGGRAT
ncbi:uncharacterized protein LOC133802052 [Humulus lupulus]|uniref:uncharacterized protein LOC133802052 n=1 Tax=Humulus lupulus TaxID=3486 RepID=UPI002B4126FD|nr:uncharacterized protein LOC133802052 [Humulus lupulus]XP_062096270.1 uncharacterized protein LOC133802052 [Humulus lupulus]